MMATVDHTFTMPGAAAEAQSAFRQDLEPSLLRAGFRLDLSRPSFMRYSVGYPVGDRTGWLLLTGWVTFMNWLTRLALGRRIEVAFNEPASADQGATVRVHARTGRGLARAIQVLGRPGHWPETQDDPDWWIEADDDPLREWDGIDPAEAHDRITRRALKRSGRLAK